MRAVRVPRASTTRRPERVGDTGAVRIGAIRLQRLRVPLDPPFPAAWDPVPRTSFPVTIVRVETDEGVVGIGSGDTMDGFEAFEHLFVGRDPLEVIREIATCERIVSSSLHGLVTADAFGIPRRWQLSERVRGAAFKFRDYAAALGMPLEPDEWATAPASVVESVVSQLRDAFREIPARLDAEPKRALHRAIQAADSARGWLVSRVP